MDERGIRPQREVSFSPEAHGCWLEGNPAHGVRIRDDVRAAVAGVYAACRRKTQSMMGETSETAHLMEIAAAQASRYIESLGHEAVHANVAAVLMSTFSRILSRHVKRLKRFELAGDTIEMTPAPINWERDLHRCLFFSELQRYLSSEAVMILRQRLHGWTWEEIATGLNAEVAAVRARFWREITDAKAKLKIGREKRRPRAANPPSRKGAVA